MGVFNLIAALGKVMREEEPDLDYAAAVDPETGRKAFANDPRPLPPTGRSNEGGFLTNVHRASRGRLTDSEARAMNMPEAAGKSLAEIKQLLDMQEVPLRRRKMEQDIEASDALEQQRRSKAKAQASLSSMTKDPLFAMANSNLERAIAENSILRLQLGNDPEAKLQALNEQLAILRAAKGGKKDLPGHGKIEAAPAATNEPKTITIKAPSGATKTVADTPKNRKLAERPGWSILK